MNILVLNWQDIKNPFGGGAEVHIHEIFKRVAAQRHNVTLFCSSFEGAPEKEVIDGINVIRRGNRNLFNYVVPWMYFRRFSKERFDIVVDDINKIPFYTPLFVKEPLVGMVLHLFRESIFREAILPAALYVYGTERLALSVYRRTPMAVISDSTKEELKQFGFADAQLKDVGVAVNHTLYRELGIQKSPVPLIGYLGRIKKYKSVDHLVRAFQRVRSKIPQARLMIVGDGDGMPALNALAAQLGVAHAVTFTGYVSSEEKVRLMNQMHVVVNTSAKEGWGLTVTEANACGVPVIASNVPGLRDAVKDRETGLLYEYGNIAELAEHILAMITDEPLRARYATAAKAFAGTFSWDACTDKMLSLLETTIDQSKSQKKKNPLPNLRNDPQY
jgi:glycosyltransferase involved in cell wall biosynthesis